MSVFRSRSCWMTRGVKQNVKSCLRTERMVPPPPTHHNTQRPTTAFQPGTAFFPFPILSFFLVIFIIFFFNKMASSLQLRRFHMAPFYD